MGSPRLSRSQRADRIRRLLRTEGDAVAENTKHLNRQRYAAVEALGAAEYERRKGEARAIKERSIEALPGLIETLTERVEANGGHVHLARDAAEANERIEAICDERGVDSVVKSKSMTTEEIEVNDALAATGRAVHETDLGEFVIQVADETPSHLVGPSIHKSRAEIADLFNACFDPDPPLETAVELTAFARTRVGDRIREADLGMTGANFLVAETGSLALVTNEGNDRKVIEATDTHVAVAGVEKIVPSLADLEPFMELLPRSGTGQPLTSYVSVLSPPIASPSPTDDNREFHLVLLDNGRMAMRDDPHLRETLYCIRCGACANSCANFQHVGGHAFGGETYTGGIATGWEAGVHGEESAAGFNDLCTGCSRCVNNCPVEIDIPWINTVVRDRINHGDGDGDEAGDFDFLVDGLRPDDADGGPDAGKRLFANFESLARMGSALAPVSNWVAGSDPVRDLLARTAGVDPRRDLPSFRRTTLRDWFAARDSLPVGEAAREVVLYPDVYTNYVHVERGKAAVRALEALDVAVRIPEVPESGRAPLSQGMIGKARTAAGEVYEALAPHLRDGRDVIVVEPSDLAMFRRDYEKLLSPDAFERLSGTSHEIMAYLDMLVTTDEHRERFDAPLCAGRVAYHSHCQQRTLGLEEPTVSFLRSLGYDVATSDVECCGMAGSFGYKAEFYDLSMDVGADLAEQFSVEGMDDRLVVASGTSCTEQLDALLGRMPRHPVELLVPRTT